MAKEAAAERARREANKRKAAQAAHDAEQAARNYQASGQRANSESRNDANQAKARQTQARAGATRALVGNRQDYDQAKSTARNKLNSAGNRATDARNQYSYVAAGRERFANQRDASQQATGQQARDREEFVRAGRERFEKEKDARRRAAEEAFSRRGGHSQGGPLEEGGGFKGGLNRQAVNALSNTESFLPEISSYGPYGKTLKDFMAEAESMAQATYGDYDGRAVDGRIEAAKKNSGITDEKMRVAYEAAANAFREDQTTAQTQNVAAQEVFKANMGEAQASVAEATDASQDVLSAERAAAGLANDPDLASTQPLEADKVFNTNQLAERGQTALTQQQGRADANIGRMQADVTATTQQGLDTRSRNSMNLTAQLGALEDERAQEAQDWANQKKQAAMQLMQDLYSQDYGRYTDGYGMFSDQRNYAQNLDDTAWDREMGLAGMKADQENAAADRQASTDNRAYEQQQTQADRAYQTQRDEADRQFQREMQTLKASGATADPRVSADAAGKVMTWLEKTGRLKPNMTPEEQDALYNKALKDLGLVAPATQASSAQAGSVGSWFSGMRNRATQYAQGRNF